MKFILFHILFVGSTICMGQASDFVVLKKNGRVIKSLYQGSFADIGTEIGSYTGKVTGIIQDSIHLIQYDVRRMPTHLGVYVLDTVAIYRLRFHYKEIIYIGKPVRKGFNWSGTAGTLMGGGVLLTSIGLGTWLFTTPGSGSRASTAFVIGAAGLAGTGYLLMKTMMKPYTIGSKYRLEYIKTTN